MWTKSITLSCVELAIYLPLVPIVLYLAYRHGKHGLLGYISLNLFVPLRIVADIISIADRNDTTPSIASAVVSSIGLSPLLLCLAGLLHEIHYYQVVTTHTSDTSERVNRMLWLLQTQFHAATIVGMVLVIIGTVNLYSHSKPLSHSKIQSDNHLREAGACIITAVWLALATYSLFVYMKVKRTPELHSLKLGRYAACVVAAVPFIGVRALYTVVYTFDQGDKSLSPITGSFAVKLVLVVLVQLLAVVAFIAGGWISRGLAHEIKR